MVKEKNPFNLTEELIAQRLRIDRYALVDAPKKGKGKAYTSKQWAMGIKFLFDKSKDCIVENWYGCEFCDKLFNKFLSGGSSEMLSHANKHAEPKNYELSEDEVIELIIESAKFDEITRDMLHRNLPKQDEEW